MGACSTRLLHAETSGESACDTEWAGGLVDESVPAYSETEKVVCLTHLDLSAFEKSDELHIECSGRTCIESEMDGT